MTVRFSIPPPKKGTTFLLNGQLYRVTSVEQAYRMDEWIVVIRPVQS